MNRRTKGDFDPELVAIRALTHLASEPERLAGFLTSSGISPETLRAAAGEPAFLAQVLDYVAADDTGLLAFAANEGLSPEAIVRARQALSGAVHDGAA